MTRTHANPARMVCHDHNERWNRICHSDALREMQLEPAEQPMPLVGYRPHWSLYAMAFGLTFILTVVGVHTL